ncbi:hypothetical protein CPLU01_02175 [Colletotrichum plurivorum]|uniref:Uncharacterized protein n=1 Tax=Colletotrichum plurivorum TaxID=2175906 RepID=A0A8H6KX36_9PEZI|nr:hypothetical protein CPLU01_02175 [Colletotrichum plurivorum]
MGFAVWRLKFQADKPPGHLALGTAEGLAYLFRRSGRSSILCGPSSVDARFPSDRQAGIRLPTSHKKHVCPGATWGSENENVSITLTVL